MIVALAGQPNSGKSTIFNHLAGYRAITANFPGTTVQYQKSRTILKGQSFQIVDLPGTYSLSTSEPAGLEALRYLLSGEADVVINVVDASLLSRSLELTWELLELEIPLVLCLNMMDEARRKGINIDVERLASILSIPVVPAVASRGQGLEELFSAAKQVYKASKAGLIQNTPLELRYSKDVEDIIADLAVCLRDGFCWRPNVPKRLLAIKLLEDDEFFMEEAEKKAPLLVGEARRLQQELEVSHGRSADLVISSERHALALNIFEQVAIVGEPRASFREKIDNLLMHKYWGYLFLASILLAFFNLVFWLGSQVEGPLLAIFDRLISLMKGGLGASLPFFIAQGVLQGLAGGIGIVLPYLVPFLIGLAILEDIGYLPRVGFLMDTFLHRIGLHGKSVISFILGYGCSVPAVMATRILEAERDRFITATLATMIPCAARTTIILALVAYYISPNAALLIYILNIFIVALAGKILSRILPQLTPGLVLEIPPYRVPSLKVVLKKSWLRIKDFIVIAWPLLIISSAFLSLLEYFALDKLINQVLFPITYILGLPVAVGTTLIFGILRKELSMLMLFQALGTTNIATVMSSDQIMIFTIFVLFYVPCISTIAVLARELGRKRMAFVVAFTLGLAMAAALIVRGIFYLLEH